MGVDLLEQPDGQEEFFRNPFVTRMNLRFFPLTNHTGQKSLLKLSEVHADCSQHRKWKPIKCSPGPLNIFS